MRTPFLKLALMRYDRLQRMKAKKRAKLQEQATQETSTTRADAKPETAKVQNQPATAKPCPENSSPPKLDAGSKFVSFGVSRRKLFLRDMSVYTKDRRWRLGWRGNLYGGRRKLSFRAITRHWGDRVTVRICPMRIFVV